MFLKQESKELGMNSFSTTYHSTKSSWHSQSWDQFFILKWNDHISTSSQGRARRIRFIFLSETATKTRQNTWNNRIQVTGNQSVKDSNPWQRERNKVKPMINPTYYLRLFLDCGAERGTQAETSDLSEFRRQRWESGGIKVTRDSWEEYQKGEMCTERKLWRSAEGSTQELSSLLIKACMWMNHWKLEKEPSHGIRENSAWYSHCTKIVCYHQPGWEKS